jgi:16S rRNA (guanine966-N2)-methyltransferase
MRIVSGTLGGRHFGTRVPEGTRPSSDRLREGLMSALESRGAIEDAHVLDLFAGTGAMGFEALSRGAKDVLAVDHATAALGSIRGDAHALGLAAQHNTLRLSLTRSPAEAATAIQQAARGPFNLVLIDSPYADIASAAPLIEALSAASALADNAWIAIEHGKATPPGAVVGWDVDATYRYGAAGVVLLKPMP